MRGRERVRGWEERGGRGGRYMYVEGGGRYMYVEGGGRGVYVLVYMHVHVLYIYIYIIYKGGEERVRGGCVSKREISPAHQYLIV